MSIFDEDKKITARFLIKDLHFKRIELIPIGFASLESNGSIYNLWTTYDKEFSDHQAIWELDIKLRNKEISQEEYVKGIEAELSKTPSRHKPDYGAICYKLEGCGIKDWDFNAYYFPERFNKKLDVHIHNFGPNESLVGKMLFDFDHPQKHNRCVFGVNTESDVNMLLSAVQNIRYYLACGYMLPSPNINIFADIEHN